MLGLVLDFQLWGSFASGQSRRAGLDKSEDGRAGSGMITSTFWGLGFRFGRQGLGRLRCPGLVPGALLTALCSAPVQGTHTSQGFKGYYKGSRYDVGFFWLCGAFARGLGLGLWCDKHAQAV